jgi:SpoVK/Ycf46/Vps4 family AAA+-type ATPase
MNSQISVSVDAYSSPVESALINNYIANNFSFPVSGIPTSIHNFKEFCEIIKDTYDIEESIFDVSSSNKTYVLESKGYFLINAYIEALDEIEISIYAISAKVAEEVYNILKPFQAHSSESAIRFENMFLSDRGSIESSISFKKIEEYNNISKSYYPYLDTDEMFRQYLLSSESLLLLSADTGLGKTKIIDLFLKYYLENIDALDTKEDEEGTQYISVVYVKNTEILSKDMFWTKLSKQESDLVILDDTDFMLISREHNDKTYSDDIRSKFISQFLSFTDGLSKNGTKFVITTNQNTENIDTAILRKGRCFDILKFRELTKQESLEIWKENELDVKTFEDYFKSDTIRACDLGSKIELHRKMKAKNSEALKDYIKEEGISVYNKSQSKKISF